ncbi:MAG: rhodanese-like domain-containing protein [Candidatus Aminicenantes bacterium]|nr:rhodanese-like domain-containing protein [Candidatus Aminicenantes bacterium]
MKKLLTHIMFIIALGVLLGFGTNFRLIKQFLGGEFQYSFISSEDFPSISFIMLPEAEELFSMNESLFVDSRNAEAFKAGHIAGAVNIPYEETNDPILLDEFLIPKEKTLVVYCDGSECQSSVGLSRLLHEQEFTDIRVFFGGWKEWQMEGLPIETGDDK